MKKKSLDLEIYNIMNDCDYDILKEKLINVKKNQLSLY